jgi:hypothetical protein
MPRDVVDLVEPFLSEDPTRWGKLASDVQWRRLQLLLLREILVELRKLNRRDESVPQGEAGKDQA